MTWDAAKSKFTRFKPFDDPLYKDLLELVFTHVREYFIAVSYTHLLVPFNLFLDFGDLSFVIESLTALRRKPF